MTNKKRSYTTKTKSQYIGVKPENYPVYGKWLEGTNHKFKTGDVVRIGSALGVVQFATKTIGIYNVKILTGIPNPWNSHNTNVDEKFIRLTDEPNPFINLYENRYPGPSSEAMKKLSDAIDKARLERYENSKNSADEYAKTLEEEITLRKNFEVEDDDDAEDSPISDKSISYSIEDDDRDSIVDETVVHKIQQELEEL